MYNPGDQILWVRGHTCRPKKELVIFKRLIGRMRAEIEVTDSRGQKSPRYVSLENLERMRSNHEIPQTV